MEIIIIKHLSESAAIDESGVDRFHEISKTIISRALSDLNGAGKTQIIYNPVVNDWQRIRPDDLHRKINEIQMKMSLGSHSTTKSSVNQPIHVSNNHLNLNINTNPLNDDGAVIDINSSLIKDIHENYLKQKPKDFIISDLYWKTLVRNALTGKNTLLVGPTGTGKTKIVYLLADILERSICNIPLGNAQHDPKTLLLGTTGYDINTGTVFNESAFVKAIQEPDTIILIDEASRSNPEAWNILLPVVDPLQRMLRLDDVPGSPIIKVHPSVSFFFTANVGNLYTAAKVMDRALIDRQHAQIELPRLSRQEEMHILGLKFPNVDSNKIKIIAQIAEKIRDNFESADSMISTDISMRTTEEMVSFVKDGFSVRDACEICIYPIYSNSGGSSSEREYIKQLIQGFIPISDKSNLFSLDDTITN